MERLVGPARFGQREPLVDRDLHRTRLNHRKQIVRGFLQLLRRAYDETSQLTPVADTTGSSSDASCDGDSCAAG